MNNLVKLLFDTNRIRLDDIEHNESISLDADPKLNELEIKLRHELAYINAMSMRKGNVYLHKSQFEPAISNRFANKIVFKAFPIIGKNQDLNGLPFKWKDTRDYDPYFFKFKVPIERSLVDQLYIRPFRGDYAIGAFHTTYANDPDDINNLYVGED